MTSQDLPIVDVHDVSYVYEGASRPALHHVNLRIRRGEFIAFVGQNGAGKTTLAKTFNGLLMPTSGTVLVDGQDTRKAGLDVFARTVGYTYQNPDHQIFSRTVRDEVAFGARNLGLNREQVNEAVQHALELVGMESKEDAYPFLLGRGERQKLAVASMIAMGPPMLIIDEPTTGQDLRGSLSILNLLLSWHKEGRTIVIITHDMNIVAEYAKRTVVMTNGQILADGPTREVLTNQPMLSQAFLRSPQITRVSQSLDGHFDFPRSILSVQEFYDALIAQLAKNRGG